MSLFSRTKEANEEKVALDKEIKELKTNIDTLEKRDAELLRLKIKQLCNKRDEIPQDEEIYWQKANQIHNWFARRLANGDLENCKFYECSRQDLIDLCATCKEVIKAFNESLETGEKIAKELLPTQEGFFFGTYEYNETYVQQLNETITDLEKVIWNWDTNRIYQYYAWW